MSNYAMSAWSLNLIMVCKQTQQKARYSNARALHAFVSVRLRLMEWEFMCVRSEMGVEGIKGDAARISKGLFCYGKAWSRNEVSIA